MTISGTIKHDLNIFKSLTIWFVKHVYYISLDHKPFSNKNFTTRIELNVGCCRHIKRCLVCAIKYCLCNRFTNYPLNSLFSLKWIGSSKSQKRYERDCSPWKHISQRATKHEKRSIQSLLDHHRWTSLHEKKRKEVSHYYIVILKCCCVLWEKEKVNGFAESVEKSIGHFWSSDAFFNESFEGT